MNIEYDAHRGILFRVPRRMTLKAFDRAKAKAYEFYRQMFFDMKVAENPAADMVAGAVEALKQNRVRIIVDNGILKEEQEHPGLHSVDRAVRTL